MVGWSMASHLRTELVLGALDKAIRRRHPSGVIRHSDQGSQYTSIAFGKCRQETGIQPAIGLVGDCCENALCKSFFATLECELLDRYRFGTRDDARRGVRIH